LFRIARALPDAAAELLSRPFDQVECRTPMECIQQVLEFMESSHMLTSVEVPLLGREHNLIHVSELEYTLHQAIDCFAKAIERDPVEPSYYAWYLAVSAGSLLLCSGNRIGSEARLHPSYRVTDSAQQSIFSSLHDDSSVAAHEVRRRLPKFETLRQQTARALQLLVAVADQQLGLRANLLVSSFLEWRQVIALLVGPQDFIADDFVTIQSLHQHYAARWAVQENSTVSLNYLKRRQPFASADNDRLEGLAMALERDPSAVNHWANLCDELGPFVDTDQRPANWWGNDRKEWWADWLLGISFSKESDIVHADDAAKIRSACSAWKSQVVGTNITNDEPASGLPNGDWSWLDRICSDATDTNPTKEDKKEPSIRRRKRTYDERLPVPFHKVMSDDTYTETGSMLQSYSWNDDSMLVLCCKLLLRGHLYGIDDASFLRRTRGLLLEAWDDAVGERIVESDAYKIIECLQRFGFDITALSDGDDDDDEEEETEEKGGMSDDGSSSRSSVSSTGLSATSSGSSGSSSSSSSSSSSAATSPPLNELVI
jgi:hypothetical protein